MSASRWRDWAAASSPLDWCARARSESHRGRVSSSHSRARAGTGLWLWLQYRCGRDDAALHERTLRPECKTATYANAVVVTVPSSLSAE